MKANMIIMIRYDPIWQKSRCGPCEHGLNRPWCHVRGKPGPSWSFGSLPIGSLAVAFGPTGLKMTWMHQHGSLAT